MAKIILKKQFRTYCIKFNLLKIKNHIRIILLSVGLLISIIAIVICRNASKNQSQLLLSVNNASEVKVFTNAYHRILANLVSSNKNEPVYIANNSNLTIIVGMVDSISSPELAITFPQKNKLDVFKILLNTNHSDGKYIVESSSKQLHRTNAKNIAWFFSLLFFILIIADILMKVTPVPYDK